MENLENPNGSKTESGEGEERDADEDAEIEPLPDGVKEGELGADPQLDRALELLKSGQVYKTFAKHAE